MCMDIHESEQHDVIFFVPAVMAVSSLVKSPSYNKFALININHTKKETKINYKTLKNEKNKIIDIIDK